LVVGYALTGERSFLDEAAHRAKMMSTRKLPDPPTEGWTKAALFQALDQIDPLPKTTPLPSPGARPLRVNWSFTHGLRIFGWTHAYGLPRLLYWLSAEPSWVDR
jgi:hypothetical protein